MIAVLKTEYPIKVICEAMNFARSTFYDIRPEKPGDKELLDSIEGIIMKWPYYGYRRVTHQLKRKGHSVGETRVRRLLKQLEHSCSVGRAAVSTRYGVFGTSY
jgi:putative transposase